MARKTKCTSVSGVWDGIPGFDMAMGVIGGIGLLLTGIWVALMAFGAASLTPASMMVAATALTVECIFGINILHKVRDYFFDHRLICIDDNKCAIAHVVTIEDNGDGDNSLNTVLAPATVDTTEAEYNAMFQAAQLVYTDIGLSSRGWNLDPKANRPTLQPKTFGHGQLPFFHCEIEGTKLDDWTTALIAYLWTLVGLAATAFALAAAGMSLGPISWIIWIAIALFVFLLSLFGLSLGDDPAGSAPAAPIGNAVPGPSGPIITDVGGNAISVGDLVAMVGYHITDSGHNPDCWNELHPLKGIAKITQSEYNLVGISHAPDDLYDKYCVALKEFVNNVGKISLTLTHLEHKRVG